MTVMPGWALFQRVKGLIGGRAAGSRGAVRDASGRATSPMVGQGGSESVFREIAEGEMRKPASLVASVPFVGENTPSVHALGQPKKTNLSIERQKESFLPEQNDQTMQKLTLLLILLAAAPVAASDWRRSAVAACLVREAGIDGREGMTAVMDVIVNRCKLSGRTPYQEVTRRKQFSSMSIGVASAVRDASKSSHWLYALSVASYGVDGWRWPVTDGSTHYYAPKRLPRAPYWVRHMEYKTTIRRHRFYREV